MEKSFPLLKKHEKNKIRNTGKVQFIAAHQQFQFSYIFSKISAISLQFFNF